MSKLKLNILINIEENKVNNKKPFLEIPKNEVYKSGNKNFVIPFEYKEFRNDEDYKILPERFCTYIGSVEFYKNLKN